jgi:hypothetical protein
LIVWPTSGNGSGRPFLHRFAAIARAPLLVAAAILYLQPTMSGPLGVFDEGIIVYGAQRVTQGELPYRDFFILYSPGQLYTVAGLFSTFGRTIMVERWWDVIVRSLLALTIYAIAARLASRRAALVAWLLAVLWLAYYSSYGSFGYPTFAALWFSLASVHALLRGLERPSWLWVAGVWLGLAAVFRHDMAVYLIAAFSVSIAGFALTGQASTATLGARLGHGVRLWLRLPIGAAVVALPMLAHLVAHGQAGEAFDQLVIFPLTVYPRVRDLLYPPFDGSLDSLPFYAPFLIYGMAALVAGALLGASGARGMHATDRINLGDRAIPWGIVAAMIFGLAGFNHVRVRSDLVHTVQFFLPSLLLLGVVLSRGWRLPIAAALPVIGVSTLLLAGLMVNPISWYWRLMSDRADPEVQGRIERALPVAQGTLMEDWQATAARALERATKPDEHIYIGLTRHDRVFVNDVIMYFLVGRKSATRYHELHPGLTTTRPVQEEMIRDLERNRVRTILLLEPYYPQEPNESSASSGITLLDDHIRAHYVSRESYGPYHLLQRIDGFAPAAGGS